MGDLVLDLHFFMSKCCENQGKIRCSTLTVCQLLQRDWSMFLPSQILSSRCRLTLCLSTSAILESVLQLPDSKSKAVPQELRNIHGNRRAYRHCRSCRGTKGFMRISSMPGETSPSPALVSHQSHILYCKSSLQPLYLPCNQKVRHCTQELLKRGMAFLVLFLS